MAGSYPDVPSRRMAYDGDGSVVVRWDSTGLALQEANSSVRALLNSEANNDAMNIAGGNKVSIVFPELREIDGAYGTTDSGASNLDTIETSADTTNGWSGTWSTELASPSWTQKDPYLHYRTEIESLAASSKRAIRVHRPSGANNIMALHVYGEIAPGETPDRILIIDETTGLEFTAAKDYGDIPRGGSEDLEIRLKNNSASETANNIQYTAEALYLESGDWYTFTLPGGATYQATQQVASLAAATTTGIITARRITPATTQLGLHAGRFYVNVDTWT